MSQPTEAPQQRGNWADALDRVGSLTDQQWQNLGTITSLQQDAFDRLIQRAQKVPLKDQLHAKVQSATARAHAVYTQTANRLSAGATQLATQGRALRTDLAARGTEVMENISGAYDRGVERVDNFRTEVGNRASEIRAEVGNRAGELRTEIGNRANEIRTGVGEAIQGGRDKAAEVRGQVGDTLRAGREGAVKFGRDVAGKASRWVNTQKSRVAIASEGARATFAAMKFDANMPQGTTAKDLSQLSQQYSKVMSAPNLEARMEALQGLVVNSQAQMDAMTAARALGGVAPAAQAVSASAAAQPQTAVQGEQKNTNVTKGTKGTDNNKNGVGGR